LRCVGLQFLDDGWVDCTRASLFGRFPNVLKMFTTIIIVITI